MNIVAKVALFLGIVATAPNAQAADLSLDPNVLTAPFVNWSGLYVGVYAGGSTGSAKSVSSASGEIVNLNPAGADIGGMVGWNWQFNRYVLGLEGEGGWNSRRDTADYVPIGAANTDSITTKSSYDARIRARGGFAVGAFLPFVSGGVSFSDEQLVLANVPSAAPSTAIKKNLTGWNVGGGLDWALTRHWTVRAEYIRDQYDGTLYGFAAPTAGRWLDRTASFTNNTGRVAAIFKF